MVKFTGSARSTSADVLSGGTVRPLQLGSLRLDQQVQNRALQSTRSARGTVITECFGRGVAGAEDSRRVQGPGH